MTHIRKLHKRNPRCVFCGRMTYLAKFQADPNIYATREHLFPRHAGGTDEASNLAVSCVECNKKRGSSLGPPPHLKPEQLRFVPMPEITLLGPGVRSYMVTRNAQDTQVVFLAKEPRDKSGKVFCTT